MAIQRNVPSVAATRGLFLLVTVVTASVALFIGNALAWTDTITRPFTAQIGTWATPGPPVPAECAQMKFKIVVYGTDGDDTLIAGNGKSLLLGFGGNDTITGGNGKDCLVGGDGNDRLLANNGPDILLGGNGDDELVGSNGPELLDGGDGYDRCLAGRGPATTLVSCETTTMDQPNRSAETPQPAESPLSADSPSPQEPATEAPSELPGATVAP
jgi:hypothetical protein